MARLVASDFLNITLHCVGSEMELYWSLVASVLWPELVPETPKGLVRAVFTAARPIRSTWVAPIFGFAGLLLPQAASASAIAIAILIFISFMAGWCCPRR